MALPSWIRWIYKEFMCEICKNRSPCAPLHQSQYFYLASRSWRLHTWSYVLPLTLTIQGFKNLLFFKLSLLLNELRVLSSIPVLPFVCDSPTTRISCLNLTTIAQSPRSIISKYSVHVSSDGWEEIVRESKVTRLDRVYPLTWSAEERSAWIRQNSFLSKK